MQDSKMIQRHLIASILLSVILQADAFSYKDAKNWGEKYPQCNGKHQSPISLDDYNDIFLVMEKELSLSNFRELPKKMTIENTGHTVEVKADWSGKAPKISGGPLHGTYVFEKATFHWAQKAFIVGPADKHPLSGDSKQPHTGDMEMHMFFYKTDFKSFKNAESKKGGLAVLRALLKIKDDIHENVFDSLEKNLHKVRSPNSTAEISPNRLLSSFLGDNVPPFTFYEGSLDYPPCLETVTWFIDDSDTPITKKLVNEFRKIKLAEGDVSNIRPTQEINKRQRQIVMSFEPYQKDDKYPPKTLK